MNKFISKMLIISVILVFGALGAVFETQAKGSVAWKEYENASKLSGKSGKHLLINFYADWCKYCKVMEKTTFQNEDVVSYMNRNFISTRINSDENRALAQEFSIRGLPSTWFVKPDGTKLTYIPGLVKPKLFLLVLKFIHTRSYEKGSFEDYVKSQGEEDALSK